MEQKRNVLYVRCANEEVSYPFSPNGHAYHCKWDASICHVRGVRQRVYINLIFEPKHNKTNQMSCGPSEKVNRKVQGMSQSQTQRRLRSAWKSFGPWLPIEGTAKTDQTGRMLMLIQVIAGRTCHIVGFVVLWLILYAFLI